MENIKRQIIIDFYRNHLKEGKPYTVAHFAKMNINHWGVHRAIKQFEAGELNQQKEGSGWKRKLNKWQERSIKANIPITANEGPYATFH